MSVHCPGQAGILGYTGQLPGRKLERHQVPLKEDLSVWSCKLAWPTSRQLHSPGHMTMAPWLCHVAALLKDMFQ